MSNGFQFLDIILFAAIAAFFVLRLRSVLGKRQGHEKPPEHDPFRRPEQSDDKIIHLPDRGKPERSGQADEEAIEADEVLDRGKEAAMEAGARNPLEAGLTQIKLADRNFDPEGFLGGAAAAFEMIVNAFAAGDTETLRPLLSDDVFEDFAGAIKTREANNERLETTLIGIESKEIIEAELQGRTAFVTVKFVSEQINVTRDAEGKVVDGDPNHVTQITDIWTFARNTRSRDPNWTLVATRSSN